MSKLILFVLAVVLIGLGVGLFIWEPTVETECAEPGGPTSGFVDEEKNCPLTIESYNRLRESETGPQWDNIGGLILIVGGLAAAGGGLVAVLRKPKPSA